MKGWLLTGAMALTLAACGGDDSNGLPGTSPTPTPTAAPTPTPTPTPAPTPTPTATAVSMKTVTTLNLPWAMTFLPDGRMLITEKGGTIQLVTQDGAKTLVSGAPVVTYSGQIGLQDIVLDPDYGTNRRVWLSYAEPNGGSQRLAVARATLALDGTPRLSDLTVIWRATPSTTGGQLGGRIAFSPDGKYLFISTGERQQCTPAQDLTGTLGKTIRLNPDGTVPADNPFVGTAGAKPEIWTLGHRNPYGLAFNAAGQLWENEMGPMGGDELNLIVAGQNYGWPKVSNGSNYDGSDIPDHRSGDGFAAPALAWTPVIAPSSMLFYSGSLFAGWQNQAIIGGLASGGLVRVAINGTGASEVQRISLGLRVREIEQAPDGSLWVLEDADPGRVVRLTPG